MSKDNGLTLYAQLKLAENAPNIMKEAIETFNHRTRHIRKLPNIKFPSLQTYSTNSEQIQIAILDNYKNHKAIKLARIGERNIEDQYQSLVDEKHHGWNRFLPQAIDEEYNARVKQLDDIVGQPYELITRGKWNIDNFATMAGYGLVGSTTAFYTLLEFMPNTPQSIQFGLSAAGGLLVGTLFGSSAHFVFRSKLTHNSTREKAQYVDSKIQEFF